MIMLYILTVSSEARGRHTRSDDGMRYRSVRQCTRPPTIYQSPLVRNNSRMLFDHLSNLQAE